MWRYIPRIQICSNRLFRLSPEIMVTYGRAWQCWPSKRRKHECMLIWPLAEAVSCKPLAKASELRISRSCISVCLFWFSNIRGLLVWLRQASHWLVIWSKVQWATIVPDLVGLRTGRAVAHDAAIRARIKILVALLLLTKNLIILLDWSECTVHALKNKRYAMKTAIACPICSPNTTASRHAWVVQPDLILDLRFERYFP